MKEQTYITIFVKWNNDIPITVDFERWGYKRMSTCMKKLIKLYAGTAGGYFGDYMYQRLINNMDFDTVQVRQTDLSQKSDKLICELSREHFLKLVDDERRVK